MSSAAHDDPCPLCGREQDPAHRPFCSRGCKDRDLLNWLGGAYRVAGPPVEDALDSASPDGLDSDGQAPL